MSFIYIYRFQNFYYIVRHLDSIAFRLPTGLPLDFPILCMGFLACEFFFRVMRCRPIDPTPNLEDQGISLCLGAPL